MNEPWYIRFLKHLDRLVKGDWGYSPSNWDTPVFLLLRTRFPATVELAIMTLLISVSIGIPVGIFQAVRRNQTFDNISRPIMLSIYSVPVFLLALISRLTFVNLYRFLHNHLDQKELSYFFPTKGRYSPQISRSPSDLLYGLLPSTDFYFIDATLGLGPIFLLDYLFHLLYPSLVLGLSLTAIIARMTRMAMIKVMRADYITLARAKGLKERIIIYRHALKNAVLPILTIGGIILAHFLTGSIFIELIFVWPGIGATIAHGGMVLDMPVIQGYCILAATIYVSTNLAVDLLYGFVDLRIRSAM